MPHRRHLCPRRVAGRSRLQKRYRPLRSRKTTGTHPVLGKLRISVGKKKTDLLYQSEGEKSAKLLITVSEGQAERLNTGMNHTEFVEELMKIASQHTLDKPNLKTYRDEWLELGHPPW